MGTMRQEEIEVEGFRSRCARSGSGGDGMLLGAWPQSIAGWERAWPQLTSSLPVVAAMDLPGFGGSSERRELSRPSALATFLPHLVGPDVGVPVALAYTQHEPSRLRSLVLSDGPGTWKPSLSRDLEMVVGSRFARWLSTLAPALFVRSAAQRGFARSSLLPEHLREYLDCYDREKLGDTLSFLASYPEALPAIDANLMMRMRTLLLWGGSDAFVGPENARTIASRLPGARLRVLQGVGHFSHEDGPDKYARALIEWCRQHEAG